MKLRTKLLIFFIALIFIPTLTGTYIYLNVSKFFFKSSSNEIIKLIELVKTILDDNIKYIELNTKHITEVHNLALALNLNYQKLLTQTLMTRVRSDRNFNIQYCAVTDKNGVFLLQSDKKGDYAPVKDYITDINVKYAIAGNPSSEYSEIDSKTIIFSHQPVYYNDTVQGVLICGYDSEDVFPKELIESTRIKIIGKKSTAGSHENEIYSAAKKVIATGEIKTIRKKIDKTNYNLIFFPVIGMCKMPLAAVCIYFPLTSINYLDKYFKRGVFILCVFFPIAFLIMFLAGRNYFLKPVLKLEYVAGEISKGNFDVSIILKQTDELGKLAITFNQMIHNIKQNRKSLSQINEELSIANQQLETYILTLSHDLKSPVVVSKNFLILFKESFEDKLTAQQIMFLDRIEKNLEKMEILIKDILEFFKLGKIRFNWQKINFGSVIEEAISAVQDILEDHKGIINQPDTYPEVICDKEKFKIVMVNLLSNAIKYSKPDTPPEIDIRWEEKENSFTFFIKDNGIGIDEIYHNRIFQLFYSLKEVPNEMSSGIGLSIVKRIIEVHGGEIGVSSQKNKGSTFFFTIPKREIPFVYNI